MNRIEIIKILKHNYPQAKCSLNFKDSWELLVATILSAQCTDRRVNLVTKNLFKKYKTITDYANSDLSNLEQDIRSTGFYRNKAKNIQNSAKTIIAEFNGRVPDQMDQLLKLSGVARKTANVVLSNAFGRAEGVVVDTHVARVSQRLGLTKNKNPEKIEQDLMKIVPKDSWIWFSHAIIEHGRLICQAKRPKCQECPFIEICPSKKIYFPD